MFEGELMDKPDLYVKLWLWMLYKANWKDQAKLKRGQFVATIGEMRDAMSYKVGYRKKPLQCSKYEARTKRLRTTQ